MPPPASERRGLTVQVSGQAFALRLQRMRTLASAAKRRAAVPERLNALEHGGMRSREETCDGCSAAYEAVHMGVAAAGRSIPGYGQAVPAGGRGLAALLRCAP